MKCIATSVISVALLICAPVLGFAQDSSLDAAFEYLKNYSFGQSRAELAVLDEAVQTSYGNTALRAEIEQRLAALITGGCSDDAVRFICRELAEIGGEASVPALVSLLGHETHAEAAVDALERNPSDAASLALRDALNTPNVRIKIGVIHALGARQDAEAAGALAALVADPQLSAPAFLALGRIGGELAAGVITDAVKQGSTELRPGAVDACLELAAAMLAAGDASGATAIYEALSGPTEANHVRAAALRGWVEAQPENASDRLLAALGSGDDVLEAAAAGLIRDLPENADVEPYMQKLVTVDAQAQLLLLPALADRHAEIPAVIFGVLLNRDEAVQLAAMRAMPASGNEEVVPLLVAVAATGKGDIKRAARECLTAMPGAKVNRELLAIARGTDDEAAAEAVRSLGERAAMDASGAVMRLAGRKADPVCTEAWRALRNIAGGGDTAELAQMLASLKVEEARAAAERAVAVAASRIAEPEKRADSILAVLKAADSEASRASLLRVLGQVPNPQALAALREELTQGSDAIRSVVVESLAGWPDSTPAEDLLAVASNPKNDTERTKAFGGYVRLMRASKGTPDTARVAALAAAEAMARDDSEKKMVLAALGDLPTSGSFDLVDAYAKEPALAAEVAMAGLNIAKAIWAAYPELVKPRLEALAAAADENLKGQAAALLGLMGKVEDYITAWQVSGPHSVPGKTADMIFDETQPPAGAAAAWHVFPMGLNPDAPFVADLARGLGGAECVAFLRTSIDAAAAGPAVLEIGSNDGVKVWLNGALIHANNVGRPLTPGEDKVPVQLNAGANSLIVAVFQMGGDWGACARLRAPDGAPLAGIKAGIAAE